MMRLGRFLGVLLLLVLGSASVWAQIPEVDVSSEEFIRSWLLCGAFPNPLAEGVSEYRHDETTLGFYIDYLAPVGGETQVQPESGKKFSSTNGKSYTWQRYDSPKDAVDFCQVFEDNQNGKVVYAACVVNSEQAQRAMLALGSNDGVRLFLNGELVWSNHRPRGVVPDSDYVWLSLRQGKNLLLAKVDQGTGGWGLIARFVDPDLVLQRIQTERRLAELSVRQKVESDQVTVWFGNASPYIILEDVPQFVLSLKDGSGAVLYTQKQSMLEGAVFSTKDLPDGPYWYECSVTLPSGEVQQQSSFFYRGDTPICATVYDRTGVPIWGDVQLLDSDFNWIEEGIEWSEKGVVKILRPDLSPFYLGILVDSPALGKRWVFTGPQQAPQDGTLLIDLPVEAAKAALSRYTEKANTSTMPAWLHDAMNVRIKTLDAVTPKTAYPIFDTLYTLKSGISTSDALNVWYAPGLEKVALEEPAPTASLPAVPVALARNEYEPFQLVLSPKQRLDAVQIEVGDLQTHAGQILSAEHIEVNKVGYVNVEEVTDQYGTLGPWPDPLPKLAQPFSVSADENTPLWCTVYAPDKQPAGVYRGVVKIWAGDMVLAEVPLEVTVFDITLPVETHTQTAYGVSPDFSWHGPLTEEQKDQVYDEYMKFCAKRRISPYTPQARNGVKIDYVGEPAHPVIDFSRFDAAMTRYIDGFKFTSFNMGGLPGEIKGHARYSEEYNRLFKETYHQVQEHLREKGWLDEVYWYWVDEPPLDAYADVKQGMELLKASCPDMQRLLTCNHEDAPIPYFYNVVNLWVPIFDYYSPLSAPPRQDLGENIWWYVCTGPKGPYPNNFIDHPAINHRIRFWQMDRYDVDGSLYWSVTYWRQNPWEQAMSIDHNGGPWGNGDGRLLYPPQPEKSETPLIEGPVSSIRFENLRDGLEDREYLHMLSQIQVNRGYTGRQARAARQAALRALAPTLTCFEMNPALFLATRYDVARAVETLSKQAQ